MSNLLRMNSRLLCSKLTTKLSQNQLKTSKIHLYRCLNYSMTNLAEPSLKNQLDSQQELIKNPEPGSPSKSLFQKFRDRRALKKSEKAKRNEYWNKMNSMDASKRDEILEEETNIMRKKVTNANNKYIFPGFFVYISEC